MERKPDVALKRCQSYHLEEVRAALVEVLAPFGGLSWVRPGMRVALKANLLTGAHPDAAVTTHPAVLTALTELLIERGAEVVIGDSPGGPFTSAIVGRAYALSGLAQCERRPARGSIGILRRPRRALTPPCRPKAFPTRRTWTRRM